jgi:hypothetical protein
MPDNPFLVDTRMKKIDIVVLATPLIGSLRKAQFCTGLGHSIRKSICTGL